MAGRRSNGDGAIRQLPSGTWRGQLMIGYSDEGKRKIIGFSGPTKGDVRSQIRDYQAQLEQGIRINQAATFSQWADEWYRDYKTQVQPSTYSNYKYTLKILKRHFSDEPLRSILPMHIGKFITRLVKDGYSKSQTSKCRAMLIQIFDAAENNMLIQWNPARKSKPLKDYSDFGIGQNDKKDAFTPEEVEILSKLLPDDLMGHSIHLMLLTGLRVQELIALTSDDISEDGAVIDVNKAIKMVDGKPMLGPPKSVSSVRKIPVPSEGRMHARYLKAHSRGPFIWSPSAIRPLYSVGLFRQRYYKVLNQVSDVRKLSPHCCRHTYVTTLQSRGVPMETIARLTGHADIGITNTYLHISMDTLATTVQVLNPKTDERKDF